MITRQEYVEYLICTIGNYTSSHLAEHLDEVSHDVVTDYLRSEHLTGRLDQIDWTAERLKNGILVKQKEVPFKVQLFKIVATAGDIDWVVTNCPDETLTTQAAQDASDVSWQIEELHRGLKQLTGTKKCQCCQGRSQRNHIACCYHAGFL